MRIELPDENWVDIRDRLIGSDKIAVHSSLKIKIKDGQEQEIGADVTDRMHDALLMSIIIAWSYPNPIPSMLGGIDAVGALDIDHYNELHEKTAELFKKVGFKAPN